MAHKYQCEALLERCMQYMSAFYHDDFPLWQTDGAVFSPRKFERIHCIGVVNLARLLGADKWLPGALMGCCMLGAEIVDGFMREDGTRETLSLEDLARCYLGRANLMEANAIATLKLLKQTVSPTCRRPERCEQALRHILSELANEADDKTTPLTRLRWDFGWMDFVDRTDVERDLCWECRRMLGKDGRQKDVEREIYERLPEMMGVKVDRWGLPEPEPAGDTDNTDPDPAAAQGPATVVPPPVPAPIVIQPPPAVMQQVPAPAPPPVVIQQPPGAPPANVNLPPQHVPAAQLPIPPPVQAPPPGPPAIVVPPVVPQVIPGPVPAQPAVPVVAAAPGP